ncbi:hypothetical protein SOM08_15200 [Hydrogenophaga sp. SNF1]|uniref:hypothetical protein n=1 Tax=Hydrogenophaga sp. SNF1 TaxID=3098762 RepID=UPI002ACBF168|nr:hypothetical protein [Hydrogenophaga sp. SNF1]WQB82341.1 hypothetical protein SOM08_15200 [Hydrogenophaga sp. SNF1]
MKAKKFKEFVAHHNASRHLALYERNGNGIFLWLARAEYRKHGVETPEALEREFDLMGARLLEAKKATDVSQALGLENIHRRVEQSAQRDIAEEVAAARRAGNNPVAAEKLAAASFRRTPGAVKTLWRDWRKKTPKEPTSDLPDWPPRG